MECGGAVTACGICFEWANVYLFVSVCAGLWLDTLYPVAIPVSTGTI